MSQKIKNSKAVEEAILGRRSMYELDDQIKMTDEELMDFIGEIQKNAPSPVNSQSTRLIVLTKSAHKQHWEQVEAKLAAIVPPEKFAPTAKKMHKFRAAYATILFFEDREIVEKLEKDFPLYADKYADWSHQANAMLQFALWTGLEANGMGVSIQHYSPLIDKMVQEYWKAPVNWHLITEMVIGNPVAPPKEKTILPLEGRLLLISERK